MWFLLVVALVTIWFVWSKWKLSFWSRKGVPSPEANIIFGNIGATLNLKEHTGILGEKWYKQFKDVPYVGYYKFTTPAVLVRDRDLAKDVLIKEFNSFSKNDQHISESQDELLSVNPFLAYDEKWKRGRSSLVPVFTAAKIKAIYPTMEHACSHFVNYLKAQPAGKDLDAKSLCAKFTTENTIKCSFSMEAGCFEPGPNEFRQLGRKVLAPSKLSAIKFMLLPIFPKWLADLVPIPMLPADVDVWFRNLVKENRKSREKTVLDDFMQAMLVAGSKINSKDAEIAGHSLSLFLEGFETSSTVLAFALYELARHPDIQDRVYNEIVEVSARYDNKFSYEALQEMSVLDNVVCESQRFNPVLLHLMKLCTAEYTLPKFGNQEEGVKIQPGTTVMIPVKAIHMDPNNYPNPEEFNPDRFTEEERKKRHKAIYLPFGEGPRMCMGMRFGHTQVKVAIMSVLKEFRIQVSPKQKPFVQEPTTIIIHHKDGLFLNFEARN